MARTRIGTSEILAIMALSGIADLAVGPPAMAAADAGSTAVPLAAIDRTDILLLLCAPDVPTMKNVRLTLQTLELLSFAPERIRLVLNRANARVGFRATQVSAVLERPVDVELPDDEAAAIGVNRGTPAVLLRRQSLYAKAVVELAERIASGRIPSPVAPGARKRLSLALGRRA